MKIKKQRSGKNDAQAKLIKKMQEAGKKIVVDPKGMEKMSEVIENFAEPLLEDCENDKDIKKIIKFAILVWNLTLIPDDDKQKNEIQNFVDTLSTSNDANEIRHFKHYTNLLVTRKRKMFSHIKRAIIDYQFSGSGSNLRLNIASTKG